MQIKRYYLFRIWNWGKNIVTKSILGYCRDNNILSNKYEQVLLNAGLKSHSWNIKGTPTESTFRSRSLLFFAAGIYVANKISPQCQLIVPENGTISINIPLDSGRRSSCSTRTTHPTFTSAYRKHYVLLV